MNFCGVLFANKYMANFRNFLWCHGIDFIFKIGFKKLEDIFALKVIKILELNQMLIFVKILPFEKFPKL